LSDTSMNTDKPIT